MRIISLSLKNFRNYNDCLVSFLPGINLIVGQNGSGKTNLLEALFLFIMGRSFRTHRLSDLISFGKTFFALELTFIRDNIEQTLKFVATKDQKKIYHNDTPLTQLSHLLGLLRGIMLSPQDSFLVTGNPSYRRHFLDFHCAQLSSEYLYHLSRYLKALKQRNTQLRLQEIKGIEVWEDEMVKSALFLTKERKKVIKELDEYAQPFQAHLSRNNDHISLVYKTQAKEKEHIDQFYREQYQSLLSKEIETGYTLSGPHKDDIQILLGAREARVFASIGQIRSTALSLKVAELSRFQKMTEEMPLFFLDDLSMGLDKHREKNLYSYISQCPQSFLTSPDSSTLSAILGGHVIEIYNGTLNFIP